MPQVPGGMAIPGMPGMPAGMGSLAGLGGLGSEERMARMRSLMPGGGQLPAGMQGGGPPGAATADAAATGTVEYTKGNILYVKDNDGNTIKVKLKSGSDVTRTAAADGDAVRPGDNVVVQGEANANGTVTATAVTAIE
jgi:hypothetical protein